MNVWIDPLVFLFVGMFLSDQGWSSCCILLSGGKRSDSRTGSSVSLGRNTALKAEWEDGLNQYRDRRCSSWYHNLLKKPHLGQMICMIHSHYSSWYRSTRQGRHIPDLCDLAHVARWRPYNLHDLAHASWVGSVPYRSCTTSHNGRLGSRWSRSWSIWSICRTVALARSSRWWMCVTVRLLCERWWEWMVKNLNSSSVCSFWEVPVAGPV